VSASLTAWLSSRLALAIASAPAQGAVPPPATPAPAARAGVPQGFENLAEPELVVADIVYAGRIVGQARVKRVRGGIEIGDPPAAARLIPRVKDVAALTAALSGRLDPHEDLVCAVSNASSCGKLSPSAAGVIYQPARFQLEIFVNPSLLELGNVATEKFLPRSSGPVSLTDSIGGAISGGSDGGLVYTFQNRAVLGTSFGRIRSDTSYSSQLGLSIDDLYAEAERGSLRYSGGLFWTPGTDFLGERKILGIGVGTQFDTRVDKSAVRSTPLVVFLPQASRVEIFKDGRLLTSQTFEAGNQALDTASFPEGSYPLVLRIQGPDGAVKEERRYFIKNSRVPPMGELVVSAYAGFLSQYRRSRPLSVSKDFYFEGGIARRLNSRTAAALSAIVTNGRGLVQAGGYLLLPKADIHAAVLASTAGDAGILLQASSAGLGPLSATLDIRRIWSRDGKPLVAGNDELSGLSPGTTPVQLTAGSYSQASMSVAYAIGRARLILLGSFRKDDGGSLSYSVGPGVYVPLVQRDRFQLIFESNATRSSTGTAAFVGLRAQIRGPRLSVEAAAGAASLSEAGERGNALRGVGQLYATWQGQTPGGTEYSVRGGAERDAVTTSMRAAGDVRGTLGSAHGDVLHTFEGRPQTQFGIGFQTGSVVTGGAAVLGAKSYSESAVVVSIEGDDKNAQFDVLVDEAPSGKVHAGDRLPIYLTPYRAYQLRIRPIGAPSVSFDGAGRSVTLYPGTVRTLTWSVKQVFTVFGQLVRPGGQPVADAEMVSPRGIGHSDDKGYFQIEVSAGESLDVRPPSGGRCSVKLDARRASSDFVRVGTVICE
jgi:hypothetical protein